MMKKKKIESKIVEDNNLLVHLTGNEAGEVIQTILQFSFSLQLTNDIKAC